MIEIMGDCLPNNSQLKFVDGNEIPNFSLEPKQRNAYGGPSLEDTHLVLLVYS